jgi:hypothetical protein
MMGHIFLDIHKHYHKALISVYLISAGCKVVPSPVHILKHLFAINVFIRGMYPLLATSPIALSLWVDGSSKTPHPLRTRE